MIVKIKQLSVNATIPVRGTSESAGLDLHTINGGDILPGTTVKLATGLAVELPPGTFGLIVPRSSAFKKGLIIQGVLDSDYRGEIFIVATNVGPGAVHYGQGVALAQMLVQRYEPVTLTVAHDLSSTDRGEGGWGSTGRHS